MIKNKIEVMADAVVHFLSRMGIKVLHNFPGGTIAPLLDACHKFHVKIITSRNEQGAGYAALAQAKISGLPGIVTVTSGPGVTNVLTPVADAYFDSIPLLVFTGQVGTADLKRNKRLRQRGFQEVNTPELMKPITKMQFQPLCVADLANIIPVAWKEAMNGRKGPVSIDLPMDIQRESFTQVLMPITERPLKIPTPQIETFVDELILAIMKSQQPVIITGNGMMSNPLSTLLKAIHKCWEAPVSHSLPGVGLVASDSTLCLGFHGHTGSQVAGSGIANADLILILGSRLDVRQTGTQTEDFAPLAKTFRVDFDQTEIEYSRINIDTTINASLEQVLPLLLTKLKSIQNALPPLTQWHQKIAEYKIRFDWNYPVYPGLSPQRIIEKLSDALPSSVVCVTGVGAHQHWAARHFRFDYPSRQLFTSAGHGAMGYDLPTAIGVAIHAPDTQVICIVGDGSFQMNIQELGVIKEYDLNIKIVILDNHRLGLVSQFQLMNWDTDTACGLKQSPDFVAIAKGYGITAMHASNDTQLDQVFEAFIETPSSALLHLEIDERHDILPMLLGKQTMDKMWPYYDSDGQPMEMTP